MHVQATCQLFRFLSVLIENALMVTLFPCGTEHSWNKKYGTRGFKHHVQKVQRDADFNGHSIRREQLRRALEPE